MNIRTLFSGVIFLCVVLVESPSVRADNVYRINTRAYRHMMATNTHAYRNMMHTRYPSQFGQDIRGFVNNNVLQSEGPVDQLIQRLLARVAAADQQNDTAATLVAQREASPDPDLTSTLGKTQEILKTLGLKEPAPPATVIDNTPPFIGTKDISHFEEPVD